MTSSTDKPKPMDTYPAAWHAAMRQVPRAFIIPVKDRTEANSVRRRFRTFIKAMRIEPEHPTSRATKGYYIWTVYRPLRGEVAVLSDNRPGDHHHRKPPSTAGGIPLHEYIARQVAGELPAAPGEESTKNY